MKRHLYPATLLAAVLFLPSCATMAFREHYDRGLRLMDREKYEEAQKELREAVRLRPMDAWAHYQFGEAICERGGNSEGLGIDGEDGYHEYEKAADLFRLTLKSKPNDIKALYGLGLSLGGQDNTDSAAGTFREVIRLKPDHLDAHFALGRMYWKEGKYEEAEKTCRACIRLAPKNPGGYLNLAMILMLFEGKYEEAEKAYREVLRLKPNDINVLMGLAESLDAQKRRKEARSYWEKALKHAKTQWEIDRTKRRLAEPD